MSKKIDVIDLTSSFTLANHSILSNEVIILDSDESFEVSEGKRKKMPSKLKKKENATQKTHSRIENVTPKPFGECPICYDELGKNPLASTKCGHVYCLKCLEQSLKMEKKCPTCRRVLKASTAYHPLYLCKD